jgi:hypothetical protein
MKDLYSYAKEKNNLNEFRIPTGLMIFPFGDEELPIGVPSNEMDIWKQKYIDKKYDWFLYNIIQKHCEKALNKHIKIHSLRHSRATYLHEIEGLLIEEIQVLLGHSNIQTTLIYVKINPKRTFDKMKNTKEI